MSLVPSRPCADPVGTWIRTVPALRSICSIPWLAAARGIRSSTPTPIRPRRRPLVPGVGDRRSVTLGWVLHGPGGAASLLGCTRSLAQCRQIGCSPQAVRLRCAPIIRRRVRREVGRMIDGPPERLRGRTGNGQLVAVLQSVSSTCPRMVVADCAAAVVVRGMWVNCW